MLQMRTVGQKWGEIGRGKGANHTPKLATRTDGGHAGFDDFQRLRGCACSVKPPRHLLVVDVPQEGYTDATPEMRCPKNDVVPELAD